MRHTRTLALALAASLLLSCPLSVLAEVTTPTSAPISPPTQTVSPQSPLLTVTVKQLYKETLPGDKPRSPILLRDKLDQYTVTLTNNQPNPVQLLATDIPNHLPPEKAYQQIQESTGKAYASMLGMGLLLAPMTFGGSFVLEALVGGPIVVCMVHVRNQKRLKYVSQSPGTIPLITLSPGESKSFTLLVDKNVKPEIHLSAQDLQNKALFNYQ